MAEDKKRATVRAARMTITDVCRAAKDDLPAWDEAVERLRVEYVRLTNSEVHAGGNGSMFHVDLSVEYVR